MAFNFMLPLRIAQFVFAILVIALEAYGKLLTFSAIFPLRRGILVNNRVYA